MRIRQRQATIVFDDEYYAGIEVLVDLSAPLSEALGYMAGNIGRIEEFSHLVLAWNLTDDAGQPVPISAESIMSQPTGFVVQLMRKWVEAAIRPPDPLSGRSSAGAPSLEASMPTVPL